MLAPTFADLSEQPDPALLPVLDRPNVAEQGLSEAQRAWRRDGVLILPRFLPDDLMGAYAARRAQFNDPHGWPIPTPYMQVPELRALALYPPLMATMKQLIGEQMMLHLCLTGWVSTERDWHQDDYLNAPFVNSWYAAVWMALDDIHPDSGPFEYIPGSHAWPLLRGHKVRSFMPPATAKTLDWPKISESFVVPALEGEIAARGVPMKSFIAERGDVLIWHGRLLHRGSKPKQPGMMRKSLICHYSGISHRHDMPRRAHDHNGECYALINPNSLVDKIRRRLAMLLATRH